MMKVYKYEESFRRMGELSGVFIAEDADVAKVRGKEVYLGEVLGKHSEVTATVNDETLTMISEDPAIVRFFEEHLDGGIGTNPVAAYEGDECDEE
jgi:hypothetical protein